MFYHNYPYTDAHEFNLDWILKTVKHLENEFKEFVGINTVKYADPIDWNITHQYGPNTVVVDPLTGDAYISLKPVPSGVLISDPSYWTVIFNYNAAISALNTRIDNETAQRINNDRFINNRIDRKNIICIGDSYLAYNSTEMVTESWGAFLRIYRGDTAGDHIKLSGLGGSGFVGNAAKTFVQLLQEADLGTLNAEDITDIVVLGGLNDASKVMTGGTTWTNVQNAINSFISYARSNFINAKIHIGYIGWVGYGFADGTITRDNLLPYILEGVRVYRNCVNYDRTGFVNYVNNIEYVVPPLPTSAYKADKIHPLAATSARIGIGLNNYLNTGYATDVLELTGDLSFSASGICTAITSPTIKIHSNGKQMVVDGGSVGFTMAGEELGSAVQEYEVATIEMSPIRACSSKPFVIPCTCAVFPGKSGTYDCLPGQLIIKDGTVYLKVFFNTSLGNYTGVNSVSAFVNTISSDILTVC